MEMQGRQPEQGEFSQADWIVLADGLSDYVASIAPDLRVQFVNRRLARVLRRSPEACIGLRLTELGLPALIAETIANAAAQVHATGEPARQEFEHGRPGRVLRSRLLRSGTDSAAGRVLCITRKQGEGRQFAERLQQQAQLDPLTGLANRRGFERQLESMIRSAREEQISHAMCYMDLDDFKQVNDSCGHGAGDELLRQLPAVIRPLVRQSDMIARLGGDEFGILLKDISLPDAVAVAESLRDAVRDFQFAWQARRFSVGASIGVVGIRRNCDGLESVLREADAACYAAKEGGRNNVHVSYPHDLAIIRKRGEQRWSNRLRLALQQDGGFRLECQSICALTTHGLPEKPVIHEMLLRLKDGQGRLILPGLFLPAAERHGLMAEIDSWVIRHVLQAIASIPANARLGHRFAINISALSFSEPAVLDSIAKGLRAFGLQASSLIFEIRENAVNLNLGAALEFMRALRELGCGLALDDFGSGISSFSYLKNLPVDMIKIDGGLIAEMINSPADEAIVRAVNDIAHHLKIATVAEAVENPAQLKVLGQLGVDYVQGFALSAPRPLSRWSEPPDPGG